MIHLAWVDANAMAMAASSPVLGVLALTEPEAIRWPCWSTFVIAMAVQSHYSAASTYIASLVFSRRLWIALALSCPRSCLCTGCMFLGKGGMFRCARVSGGTSTLFSCCEL